MDTKKLRQKILDLAIRGKLVPQDPNDEPASVLLERIKAEKEQLIKEGKIKRPKKTSTSDKSHYENVPFEIPEGWVWTTIENICSKIGSGSTPKGSNYSSEGIIFFRSQNVYNDGIVLEDIKYISEEVHKSMSGTEVLPNDLLLNITGGSLGRCAIVSSEINRANVSQHVCILRPILVKTEYLHMFILSSFFAKTMKITGSGREGLPKYNLEKMYIPLPPLEEQERIISEIKKWNNIIEIIECKKSDIKEVVSRTKSKVLDLAISGKLVSQDPTDEPAIELLKRINPNFTPCDNSHYENVPDGWEIVRFKDVFKSLSTREHQIQQKEIAEIGEIPVISQSANYIEGYSNQKDKTIYPQNGVIIFGDHTRVVKYIDFPFIVGADGVKIIQTNIYDKFAYYLILYTSLIIENKGYSRHFQFLSKSEYIIPPLEEQKRIANKISQIWDAIETITAEL